MLSPGNNNTPQTPNKFTRNIEYLTSQVNAKRLRFFIRYVVIIGILIPVIFSFYVGHETMLKLISVNLRPDMIWIPFVAYLGIYLIDAWRLQIVLYQYGIKFGFVDGFYNSSLFLLFANLTPAGSGAYPAQIFHLMKNGVDSKIAANLSLSRVVVFILACFLVVVIFFNTVADLGRSAGTSIHLIYAGVLVFLVMTGFYLLLLIRPSIIYRTIEFILRVFVRIMPRRSERLRLLSARLSSWVREMMDVMIFLWKEKYYIVLLDLLLTMVVLCLQAYSLYYVLTSLTGWTMPFMDMFVIFVALNIFAGIIPTPGGTGGVEWFYAFVFSGLTGRTEETMLAVLAWRFATYYLHLGLETLVFFALPFVNPSLRNPQ